MKDSQISAVISETTKDLMERHVRATGVKKGQLVEQALRHHLQALQELPARGVPMLERMFEKRLRGYRAIGYARGEAPLGFGDAPAELVLEYDEEAFRALDSTGDFA